MARGSKKVPTQRRSITLYFFCSSEFTSSSKEVRVIPLTILEKFDDIKFGKVLTKLYARLFTMEKVKYLPPKYSYAMKDLAEFLGIFEITEDQIKQRRSDGGISDTSSNLSYVTQSAFIPKKS